MNGFATVSGMLDKMDGLTNILSTDKYGFNVNGIHMRGSIIAFPTYTLLWNCLRVTDASPRNLAIVHAVRPKPDILIIGTGDSMGNINPALYGYFSRKGISVEPMSSTHAIATFNVLIQEGRNVAAAMISRTPVTREEACLYTPEARSLASSTQERALAEALGGRATQLALEGTSGMGRRLLTDGGLAPARVQPESHGNGAADVVGSVSGSAGGGPERRAIDVQSLTVSTKYGYPGALPADVSPVRAGAGAGPGTRLMPKTAEEVLDAMARKGARKSGVQPPPGTARKS